MIPRAAAAAAHAVGLTPISVPPDHQRQASLSRADLGRAERERIAPHQLPRMRIATAVDVAIGMSTDRQGFMERLRDLGVEVEVIKKSGGGEQGIRFRMAEEGARWWKGSGLGKAYSLKSIDRRLAGDIDQLVAAQRFADRKRKSAGVLEKLAREQHAGKEILRWGNGYVAAVATSSEIRWRTGSVAESSVCAALAREKGWTEMILSDRGSNEKNLAAVEAYHRQGISVQLGGQRYPAPTSSVTQQMKGPVNGNDGRNTRASEGRSGAAAPIFSAAEVDGVSSQRSPQEAQRHDSATRPVAPVLPSAINAAGQAVEDDQRHRPAGQETSAPQGEEQVDLLDFLNDPVGTRARAQRALEDLSEVNPGDHAARIVAEAQQPQQPIAEAAAAAADPLDFLDEQNPAEPETVTAQVQETVTHQPQSAPVLVLTPTDEDIRRAEDEAVAQRVRYEGDMEGARPRGAAQIEGDLVAARQQREWHEMQSVLHRLKPSTVRNIAELREREAELEIALVLARKREAEARRQIRRDPAAVAAIQSRASSLACKREERKKADELRRLTEKTKRELAQRQKDKDEEAKRQREREEVKPTKKRKGKTEWKPN